MNLITRKEIELPEWVNDDCWVFVQDDKIQYISDEKVVFEYGWCVMHPTMSTRWLAIGFSDSPPKESLMTFAEFRKLEGVEVEQ